MMYYPGFHSRSDEACEWLCRLHTLRRTVEKGEGRQTVTITEF